MRFKYQKLEKRLRVVIIVWFGVLFLCVYCYGPTFFVQCIFILFMAMDLRSVIKKYLITFCAMLSYSPSLTNTTKISNHIIIKIVHSGGGYKKLCNCQKQKIY